MRGKESVKEYLVGAIKKQLTEEKIRAEEFIYKTLGVIPKDFNYTQGIVELYISQLGGYYDPDKKEYTMAAWLPAAMQPVIAVHELTHALQDQHFNLKDFMDEKKHTSDELLSRSAVVEGDATAVMTDYQRNLMGMGPVEKDSSVESVILQTVLGSFVSESLQKAPSAIRNMLIFPYASGLRFVHTFLKQGGYKKIDTLLKNPPQTTEEILHPEKYGKKEEFIDVNEKNLFALAGADIGEISYSDRYGEFFISTWLSGLGVSNAPQRAAGWGGDRVFVVNKNGERKLYWVIRWDSEGKAREFQEAVEEKLKGLSLSIKRNASEICILG